METIHAQERRLLLKALQRVRITDPSLLTGGTEPATPAQLDELESVLADGNIRLLMLPNERAFSVPVRVQVLACSEKEAALLVESLVTNGRDCVDEEAVIGWEVSAPAPFSATELKDDQQQFGTPGEEH